MREAGVGDELTDFGEGNQLASSLTGFIDEVDGLLSTALEIEPAGLGGNLHSDQHANEWLFEHSGTRTAAALYLVMGILEVMVD